MTDPEKPDHAEQRVEHRAETAVELAATPDEVWAAIATADGISAWMVPAQLDPCRGGEVFFDHGGLQSTGVVTDYAPTHRFAYEESWPMTEDMRGWVAEIAGHEVTDEDLAAIGPIATEFLIEAVSGGSCVLRVVSSSYGSGAEWEHEFFAEMVAGWGALPYGPDELEPYLPRLIRHLQAAGASR